MSGKHGIISKKDALSGVLSKKHRGAIEYIGQMRNAVDHGVDPDENSNMWEVRIETAMIYPILVATTIRNILDREETGKIFI